MWQWAASRLSASWKPLLLRVKGLFDAPWLIPPSGAGTGAASMLPISMWIGQGWLHGVCSLAHSCCAWLVAWLEPPRVGDLKLFRVRWSQAKPAFCNVLKVQAACEVAGCCWLGSAKGAPPPGMVPHPTFFGDPCGALETESGLNGESWLPGLA